MSTPLPWSMFWKRRPVDATGGAAIGPEQATPQWAQPEPQRGAGIRQAAQSDSMQQLLNWLGGAAGEVGRNVGDALGAYGEELLTGEKTAALGLETGQRDTFGEPPSPSFRELMEAQQKEWEDIAMPAIENVAAAIQAPGIAKESGVDLGVAMEQGRENWRNLQEPTFETPGFGPIEPATRNFPIKGLLTELFAPSAWALGGPAVSVAPSIARAGGKVVTEGVEQLAKGARAGVRAAEEMGPFSPQLGFVAKRPQKFEPLRFADEDEAVAGINRSFGLYEELDDIERRIDEAEGMAEYAKQGMKVVRPAKPTSRTKDPWYGRLSIGKNDESLIDLAQSQGRNPFEDDWWDSIGELDYKNWLSTYRPTGGRAGIAKNARSELSGLTQQHSELKGQIQQIEDAITNWMAPDMAPSTSVQTGLPGIGPEGAQGRMLEEFGKARGTEGQAPGLVDKETLLARERAKPLPGQGVLPEAPQGEVPPIKLSPRAEVSDEVIREEMARRQQLSEDALRAREQVQEPPPPGAEVSTEPPAPGTEAGMEPPISGAPPRQPPGPPAGEVPGGVPPDEGLPERGFATHTAESPMGDPVLRKLYDEDPVLYGPITNKRTLDAAAKAVDEDAVAARARVMADDPLDPDTMVDTMAQGIVLMRRAATEKNTKELYELSRHIAERLTSSAQSVQLASTIDKLTPEGLFVYMNRIIKKAIEKGQGPTVAKRMRQAAEKEMVRKETQAAGEAVAEAERKVTQARKRVKDVEEAATPDFVAGKPTTRGNQRARDLEYLIDDSVREVKASLTPADRQAIIKAKAILKQSVAEMDIETANSFLDRAAALDGLAGEERTKALMDLIEEVRQLPEVRAGDVMGGVLKPSPRLLKEQAADLEQMIDRTARNVFQQLNSIDRLAVARVKDILRRTDIELPQGMAEELLTEARNMRGLPKAEQPVALTKLTDRIKEYDPVAKELARKRAIADAEARVRQEARQAANDLEALIDAQSRKTGAGAPSLADRKAIGQAKAVLSKHGAELPEDMATDFLERAKALNSLPEAEQADAIRALVDEIKNFDPVKEARETLLANRKVVAAAKQRAKDLAYLTDEELRVAKARLKNVERDAIRTAKSRFKAAGVEMPEELAQSFLDRAQALLSITDEYDQMRAAQSLLRDVNSLLPPSKWDTFLNVIGLPRALKATWDDSFLLRQGIFGFWGDNKAWRASAKASLQALRSEDAAIAADRAYFARPLHKPLQEAGLEYLDRWGKLSQQEETFMTSWAGLIPGVKQSERGYVVAGNKLRGGRADDVVMGWLPDDVRAAVEVGQRKFSNLDELVQATGKTKEDIQRLAQWANATTGRGSMGNFLKANNQWLNALFFAPRFAVSRFEVPYLATRIILKNPALRSTVGRDLGGFVMGSATVLAVMDQVPGVEVEWDPRSSDFGKIRYGALSIDFLGGYAPLIRYAAQMLTGQKKSRGGAIVDVNRLEVLLENFFGTKLSPAASEGVDLLRGEDALGNKIDTWEERLKRIAKDYVPFLPQDMYEAWQEMGIVGAAISAPVSFFGGSIGAYQTVSDKFDAVAKNATGGKIQKWQDLPPVQRLQLESSPEVKALLDPGDTGIPMNLRKYLEPKDYKTFTDSVDAVKADWAKIPEVVELGMNAPVVSDEINKKPLTLQQRAEYERLAWQYGKDELTKAFNSPYWSKGTPEIRKKLISTVLGYGRERAKKEVLAMK